MKLGQGFRFLQWGHSNRSRKGAAQLKHRLMQCIRLVRPANRSRKGAAQLKPQWRRRQIRHFLTPNRSRKGAAQLKRERCATIDEIVELTAPERGRHN